MPKRTLIVDGGDPAHFFLAVEKGTLSVGESPTLTKGLLRDIRVTRIHCEIEIEDDRDRLPIDEPGVLAPHTLRQGETVKLGQLCMSLMWDSLSPEAADIPLLDLGASAPVAAEAPPPPSANLPRRLKVVDGADQGRTFRLPESGNVVVGKPGGQTNVGLHDLYVSKSHCALEITAGTGTATHAE